MGSVIVGSAASWAVWLAQLRAADCRAEAEQGGDSRKVLLNLKMLLQPSQEGTVLPHVPRDKGQPGEMLGKSQQQKRSTSQGKTDLSMPLLNK